jgi:MFS family permease
VSRWRVSGTVWALGFTSLLTDVSSEMVASVLPIYLVFQVGLSPLAFGVIDGLYQGVAALVRVGAGIFADRWQRYKEIATAGYALSALCRLAILAAGTSASSIAAVIALDRIGKGVRTAPRDALISLRSSCRDLATSFGVHRSLDAMGAMLGPVVAFLVLARLPGAFDVLFVAGFAIAAVGVAVIVLFVPGTPRQETRASASLSWQGMWATAKTARFRAILIAAFVLSVPTISDSFIFLYLQQRFDFVPTAFPLLYVGTSVATSVFAVPFGRAADRWGRTKVLLGGYVLLISVYLAILVPVSSAAFVIVPLALLGGYYAATDGVLTAMAAAVLPSSMSGTGLAAVATVVNIGRFLASVIFGFVWVALDVDSAVLVFLVALLLAIVAGGALLVRSESLSRPTDAPTGGVT